MQPREMPQASREGLPPGSGRLAIKLIVGLGNPGREYRETRHNVGFMILDQLAAREKAEFRREKTWQAEVARTGDLLLCKPLTYMNLSGQSVRPLSQFYKIEPAQMLVILDDMALPLGKLRLRPDGSAVIDAGEGFHIGLRAKSAAPPAGSSPTTILFAKVPLEEAVAIYENRGVTFTVERTEQATIASFRDPDANLICLVQAV